MESGTLRTWEVSLVLRMSLSASHRNCVIAIKKKLRSCRVAQKAEQCVRRVECVLCRGHTYSLLISRTVSLSQLSVRTGFKKVVVTEVLHKLLQVLCTLIIEPYNVINIMRYSSLYIESDSDRSRCGSIFRIHFLLQEIS